MRRSLFVQALLWGLMLVSANALGAADAAPAADAGDDLPPPQDVGVAIAAPPAEAYTENHLAPAMDAKGPKWMVQGGAAVLEYDAAAGTQRVRLEPGAGLRMAGRFPVRDTSDELLALVMLKGLNGGEKLKFGIERQGGSPWEGRVCDLTLMSQPVRAVMTHRFSNPQEAARLTVVNAADVAVEFLIWDLQLRAVNLRQVDFSHLMANGDFSAWTGNQPNGWRAGGGTATAKQDEEGGSLVELTPSGKTALALKQDLWGLATLLRDGDLLQVEMEVLCPKGTRASLTLDLEYEMEDRSASTTGLSSAVEGDGAWQRVTLQWAPAEENLPAKPRLIRVGCGLSAEAGVKGPIQARGARAWLIHTRP